MMTHRRLAPAVRVSAAITAAVVAVSAPCPEALAGAVTFQTLSSNIANASSGFNGLISIVCWIGGAAYGVAGIFKIKSHMDKPGEVPLREGLIRLTVGGALLAFPFIMAAMQGSISNGWLPHLHASSLLMDTF